MLENNFGLSGQVISHDEFLCLSKACREEKKKKRALRNEKRELKNEERRAEIEQMRTETDLMKRVGTGGAPRTVAPPVQQQADSISYSDSFEENNEGEDEGSNNTWLYVGIGLGVLLLAGAAFLIIRKRRKAAAESLSNSPLSPKP